MPKHMESIKHIQDYWELFVSKRPEFSESRYRDSFYFCDNEHDANDCADLVVRGIKRATAASQWSYEHENEALPEIGEINIVTDWSNNPVAVIRTSKIELVPYAQVTAEFAATEGEGDKSLAYWQRVHWDFYTREMQPHGASPSSDMLIVCEYFEKLFPD